MPDGGIQFRASSKVVFGILLIILPVLTYLSLTLIEQLDRGADAIMVLAYGVIVLMVGGILLVVIISMINYLRRFE